MCVQFSEKSQSLWSLCIAMIERCVRFHYNAVLQNVRWKRNTNSNWYGSFACHMGQLCWLNNHTPFKKSVIHLSLVWIILRFEHSRYAVPSAHFHFKIENLMRDFNKCSTWKSFCIFTMIKNFILNFCLCTWYVNTLHFYGNVDITYVY